jgi:hypothetical protein
MSGSIAALFQRLTQGVYVVERGPQGKSADRSRRPIEFTRVFAARYLHLFL